MKVKTFPSTGKIMAMIFCDCTGILLSTISQRIKLPTGHSLLSFWKKWKLPLLKQNSFIEGFIKTLHRHTPIVLLGEKLDELWFQVVPQSRYFLDLTSSDVEREYVENLRRIVTLSATFHQSYKIRFYQFDVAINDIPWTILFFKFWEMLLTEKF